MEIYLNIYWKNKDSKTDRHIAREKVYGKRIKHRKRNQYMGIYIYTPEHVHLVTACPRSLVHFHDSWILCRKEEEAQSHRLREKILLEITCETE